MNIACMLENLQKKTFIHHTKWRDIFICFNCFNNFFTFRFKRKLSERSSRFEKTIVFIILNARYLWHSTIFANTTSNSLQKSFLSSSSSSFQTSVRLHDCHVRYELNASTNKSSRSHILSIDKRERNQLIASKRNWKKTRSNVTSVHRFQHLKSTFDRH